MEIVNNREIYKADLQRVGSLIDESIAVLSEYAKLQDWESTKKKVISKNLLMKRSSKTLAGILHAIHKRLLVKRDLLPDPELLAEAISKGTSKTIKTQLLYPYICESDPLVKNLLLNLVAKKIGRSSLTDADVREFLDAESISHPELLAWSDCLRTRWIKGFFAFLRDFGFMEKAPSHNLTKPLLRVESFTFFLVDMLEKKVSTKNVLNSEIWDLYMMDQSDIEYMLSESQAHGWIYYLRAGDVIELGARSTSRGWISDCLG